MTLEEIEHEISFFEELHDDYPPRFVLEKTRVRKLLAVAKLVRTENYGIEMIKAMKELEE